MRVIRPARLADDPRGRSLALALATIGVGATAAILAMFGGLTTASVAALAGGAAALGLGVGMAWLRRALRPDPQRQAAADLERLLRGTFDDAYTLILAPRLPVSGSRLTGLLVGPPGVWVLTVRDWDGRYRIRGRGWEYDAGGHTGWIPCITNPSFETGELVDGVRRWAAGEGMQNVPLHAAIAFPNRASRLTLEEPADEIITVDNVPWWANAMGRVQRLNTDAAARFVAAVLDAGETPRVRRPTEPLPGSP